MGSQSVTHVVDGSPDSLGMANCGISAILSLCARTVDKHLERNPKSVKRSSE